jgi:hypothetical protein
MSTELTIIKNTGKSRVDLQVTEFSGGSKGRMLQLTQGFGLGMDNPGFIQLTEQDAKQLLMQLMKWVKGGK